jgi:L-alanine-DL-glutamate epimerase-like enolase superfamily enzyme
MGQVAQALDIAVAAGEQEYTLQGIGRLIDAGVDIVQPDIIKTGGFTGLLEMAALAKSRGIDFVPHQTQPSVGHVANMHFIAALAHNHHPIEFAEKPNPDGSGPQNVVFKNPVRPKEGYFTLPTGPGLGLELDEEELRKRLVEWK